MMGNHSVVQGRTWWSRSGLEGNLVLMEAGVVVVVVDAVEKLLPLGDKAIAKLREVGW